MTEDAYAELHCHSNYSFQEGASFTFELVQQARKLGLAALAITDHDNLSGAMEFAKTAKALGLKGIIGAELTLAGDHHLTLLAENVQGYNNLCRLLSYAHIQSPRRSPAANPDLLAEFSEGLIALSGCRRGEVSELVAAGRIADAERAARRYREWFGPNNFYLELQRNLVFGDDQRIAGLVQLGERLGIGAVATNNVHYHVRSRYRVQDALVAIQNRLSLEESQRERRANSEFFLKSPSQMARLFRAHPPALRNTLVIAERCTFDLTRDLNYRFPDYPVPPGFTPDTYLEKLCYERVRRRYPLFPEKVRLRLEHELRLIRKHGLAGFLLIYHEIILMAQQVMVDLGLCEPGTPLEHSLPGRGRGSSVAMLVGYLIGLSHIDPLQYNLSLERFLPEDAMTTVPDIDLDFPRNIREELIKRVHAKWGWEHAALTGMIATYDTKGAIRDLGKALGLPPDDLDKLAKRVEHTAIKDLKREMQSLPDFRDKVEAPGWKDLLALAVELDGFPKYLAQHPGGMVISSTPLMDLVPVQPAAMDGRFIIQWDKDAIDDAGFVKIDFLALGALSQMQEALALIERRHGKGIDLSRIDFEDQAVYRMIHRADTIGVFQIESAAQMQTVVRLKPRNLMDMAHEVGAVRPGVGVNDGVALYIARRLGRAPVLFDHPLERRALERTLGVILFQDQVNQLAIDVAGFSPSEADQFRRAFGRKNNRELLVTWWQQFRAGAAARGVPDRTARTIFKKFNGFYMFPEAHALAFGVTAYQATWLKHYYPLEFYIGLFNEQPMGFWSPETLKEDARRHGILVLNPDINRSMQHCTPEDESLRLGFLYVSGVGQTLANRIVQARAGVPFTSVADFLDRTGAPQRAAENLVEAGAFDGFGHDRRSLLQEVALRYRPVQGQAALRFEVAQDFLDTPEQTEWERMEGEYRTMGVYPGGHVMEHLREQLAEDVAPSNLMDRFPEGAVVKTAGLVVRRQHPVASAVFLTLEDEFGHVPLILWLSVYRQFKAQLREPFVLVTGRVSRRDGTFNLVVERVEALRGSASPPRSKDWR
ncbi:MAG: DNA polymerase III subunit alpha [Chloroflexi bacterium]|nr:DNA polymerase III subunit alpha [Chloroflexota bacterium]